MTRARWEHEATAAVADVLHDHDVAVLHFSTTGEADHSFRINLATLELLRQEIDAALQRGKPPSEQG